MASLEHSSRKQMLQLGSLSKPAARTSNCKPLYESSHSIPKTLEKGEKTPPDLCPDGLSLLGSQALDHSAQGLAVFWNALAAFHSGGPGISSERNEPSQGFRAVEKAMALGLPIGQRLLDHH